MYALDDVCLYSMEVMPIDSVFVISMKAVRKGCRTLHQDSFCC